MKNESLQGLNLEERRLNLAYQVFHRFLPNPDRILSLPDLFDVMASPHLVRLMTQLWHADAVAAATVEETLSYKKQLMEARDFWFAQSNAWESATKTATASMEALKAQCSSG